MKTKETNFITVTEVEARFLAHAIVARVWPEVLESYEKDANPSMKAESYATAEGTKRYFPIFKVQNVKIYSDNRGRKRVCFIKNPLNHDKRFVAPVPVPGIPGMFKVNLKGFMRRFRDIKISTDKSMEKVRLAEIEKNRMEDLKRDGGNANDEQGHIFVGKCETGIEPDGKISVKREYISEVSLTLSQAVSLFSQHPEWLKMANFSRYEMANFSRYDNEATINLTSMTEEQLKPFFQGVQEARKLSPQPEAT